jgi:geranylgeranyl pyrophosphate synthase
LEEKNEEMKVTAIKALYDTYEISAKTLDKAEALYNEALLSLTDISIPDAQKANLRTMAEMIHNRDF